MAETNVVVIYKRLLDLLLHRCVDDLDGLVCFAKSTFELKVRCRRGRN